jgi:nucleoside-diphosphate-sugar epimerase
MALRPRAIIAPDETALLPRLLRAAGRGTLPLPHDGAALIELSDARDMAAAFIAASEKLPLLQGRAFNLSGGQPLPFRDIARHLFKRMNRTVRFHAIDRNTMLGLAGALEFASNLLPGKPEPPITRYTVMALGWSQTFDLTGAKSALGWTPQIHPFDAIDWALSERGHA